MLSGEPDAGNLHVRFDEGRGSRAPASLPLLLYRLFRRPVDEPRTPKAGVRATQLGQLEGMPLDSPTGDGKPSPLRRLPLSTD